MKKIMAFGGLAGFSLSMGCGLLSEGSNWTGLLLRSSASALICGLLFKWWAGVAARCLAQAHQEREAAAAAAKPPSPFAGLMR